MPKIDLSLENIWERQVDEETEVYRAFVVYRDLDPPGSVEQACRKALGERFSAEALAQWEQWAEDWAWEFRANQWRQTAETAAARARDLTERWHRAKEFYNRDKEEPRGLGALLGRFFGKSRGRSVRRKESVLRRWARERDLKRHIAATEAAALKAERGRRRPTLAQRWTLFIQRKRSEAEEQKDKGWRGRLRRTKRRLRVIVSRHTGRFVLIFGALCLLVGAFLGMLFLRWRRLVFQHAVVMAVNQASIRRDEFQARLEEVAARTVLQEMVERNLRRQFAIAKKAYPTDKEVEERLAEDRKDPAFMKSIAAAGMTLQKYREAIRDELAQAKLMSEGVTVTEEEVRKYYERNIDRKNPQARFFMPETIQVAVIGTRTREAAEAALQDLKDGVPWEEVARTHSLDVSAFSGGLLPPFARGRTMAAMIPGMEAAIFAMEPGQRIGPVKYGDGWWIIQCREKAPEKTLPFELVKIRARLWARMEKGIPKNGRRVASEYAAFQKRAKVQVFDPFFRSLMAR